MEDHPSKLRNRRSQPEEASNRPDEPAPPPLHGDEPDRGSQTWGWERGGEKEWQKEGNKRGSKCHVVDCDLKSFFDTVDHGKLMGRLRDEVDDFRLLRLIARYLKAGVILPDGTLEETTEGVPQGGPLSRSRS